MRAASARRRAASRCDRSPAPSAATTSRTIVPGSGKNRSRSRWNARFARICAHGLDVDASSRAAARPAAARPRATPRSRARRSRNVNWPNAGRFGDPADLDRALVVAARGGSVCVENGPNVGAEQLGGARRRPAGTRASAGDAARHRDPRRLQRERALQVVLRDDLVADLGVRERAAPQRGRAIGAQADRLIERARGLVRLARGTAARGRGPSSRARAAGTREPRARSA